MLISSCGQPVNEVKVGKLPIIIASHTCNLFQNYFKEAKTLFFAQLYQNPTDCFASERLLTLGADLKIGISIGSQEKENFMYS